MILLRRAPPGRPFGRKGPLGLFQKLKFHALSRKTAGRRKQRVRRVCAGEKSVKYDMQRGEKKVSCLFTSLVASERQGARASGPRACPECYLLRLSQGQGDSLRTRAVSQTDPIPVGPSPFTN